MEKQCVCVCMQSKFRPSHISGDSKFLAKGTILLIILLLNREYFLRPLLSFLHVLQVQMKSLSNTEELQCWGNKEIRVNGKK